MFGRNKTTSDSPADTVQEVPAAADPAVHGRTAPKGRPTPKRRDQEAARRTPLVPADREAAKRDAKQRSKAERVQQREAMARGDEKALPARDRGPIKKFIRDSVDARVSLGEILMPLVLVVLAVSLLPNKALQESALILIWLIILAGVIDSVLLWQRIKKRIQERFGEEPPKGSTSYAMMRSFQMRITRMPKPQVKRGAKV